MPTRTQRSAVTSEDSQQAEHRLLCFVALPIAVLLMVIAAIVLPVRIMQLRGDGDRRHLLNLEPMNRSGIERLSSSRQSALAWHANAESLGDIASVALLNAQRHGLSSSAGQKFASEAMALQKQVLARSPADPFIWSQLSYLQMLSANTEDNRDAAQSLALSLETGNYEPQLMLPRLEIMMRLWDRLDEPTRAYFPFIVRNGWRFNPRGVVNLAQTYHFIGMVEQVMADDPKAMAEFTEMTRN